MGDTALPKFKDYAGQQVNFIQPKLDGHYTKVVKDHVGEYFITSKKPKDITLKVLAIDHIREELYALPNNSIVLAELHCPGVDATSVPTMLNDADEKLMLTAFAAPLFAGADFSEVHLEIVMGSLKNLGLNVAETTKIRTDFVNEKLCGTLNERAIEEGYEGHVLKVSHMSGWYKHKPVRTLDAVVVETFMSTSESYWGCLQAVRVIVYKPNGKKHDLGHVGIGTKAEKLKYDTEEKRATLIGRVCECEYDKIGARGGMRFPRWKRWRDDEKSAHECTTEQFKYYKGKLIA